jgi:Tfp pilus assembly protein PilF
MMSIRRTGLLGLALASALASGVLIFMPGDATAQKKSTRGGKAAPAARKPTATSSTSKTIIVKTEPKAVVWLDDVRHGTSDDAGQLMLKKVSAGRHTLRVRARGFGERNVSILPTQRGNIAVPLTPTKDEAELLFQQAEEAAEKGGEERPKAIELYRRALKLRPKFPAAHVGLARVLMAQEEHDAALEEIAEARRDRPVYAEASAVEGRILRDLADHNAAIEAFDRAIREGRGFQPEAHTGKALAFSDLGQYEPAVESFRKAIAQLSDTEPALYQLLGETYEKLEKWKEAVAAYEKYLELAPEGRLAPAIRSIIDQLRQQAAEQQ